MYTDAGGYPYAATDYEASQQQQAYANSFVTLPPLPGRGDQAPPRSSSQPRAGAAHYADPSSAHLVYPQAGLARTYANATYPAPHTEEPDRASWMQGGFQPKLSGFASEADPRRRTISAGGALGAQSSHESLGGGGGGQHRTNGFVSSPQDMGPSINNTGRTTPVGGVSGGPKSRFTLDDHMSHRSPKNAVTPATSANSSASKPPSAMAIPTIPPFDRNRHEKHLLAQAQAKPNALFGAANSSSTSHSAAAQQGHLPSFASSHPLSTASSAGVQRAG